MHMHMHAHVPTNTCAYKCKICILKIGCILYAQTVPFSEKLFDVVVKSLCSEERVLEGTEFLVAYGVWAL